MNPHPNITELVHHYGRRLLESRAIKLMLKATNFFLSFFPSYECKYTLSHCITAYSTESINIYRFISGHSMGQLHRLIPFIFILCMLGNFPCAYLLNFFKSTCSKYSFRKTIIVYLSNGLDLDRPDLGPN